MLARILHGDLGVVYHAGPQLQLAVEHFFEVARRADLDLGAGVGQPLLGRRIVERFAERGIELGDDIRRRSGRRDHAEPERRVDLGIALLAGGWHAGQPVGARRTGDGYGAELAGLDVRQDRGHRVRDDLDLACDGGDEHGRSAAIGHMREAGLGLEFEQLEQQMRRDAEALRAPAHFAGIGLGIGDQLRHRLHRQVRMHGDDQRRLHHLGDRHEHLHRVVADVLVHGGAGGERATRRQQDGVAVGVGARDELGADAAARAAAAVLDHDALAEHRAEPVGDDARHAVGRPAGRERHDHLDRLLGRPGLRLRGAGEVQCAGDAQGCRQQGSNDHHACLPEFAPRFLLCEAGIVSGQRGRRKLFAPQRTRRDGATNRRAHQVRYENCGCAPRGRDPCPKAPRNRRGAPGTLRQVRLQYP
jgi:hypothetical protein